MTWFIIKSRATQLYTMAIPSYRRGYTYATPQGQLWIGSLVGVSLDQASTSDLGMRTWASVQRLTMANPGPHQTQVQSQYTVKYEDGVQISKRTNKQSETLVKGPWRSSERLINEARTMNGQRGPLQGQKVLAKDTRPFDSLSFDLPRTSLGQWRALKVMASSFIVLFLLHPLRLQWLPLLIESHASCFLLAAHFRSCESVFQQQVI